MPTHRDLRHEPIYAEVRAYAAQVYGEQSNQSIRASSISIVGDASKAALTTWRFDQLEGKGRPVIALLDLISGATTYPIRDDGEHQMPAWSPDGSRLAWLQKRGRLFELVTATATGLEQPSRVEGLSGVVEAFVWAQDGRRLLIQTADSDADLAGYQGATAGVSDTEALPSWAPTIETPTQENRSRRLWTHEVGSDRSKCVSGQLTVWESAWAGSDSAIAIVSDNPGETAWYEARLAHIDLRTRETRTLYRPKEQLGRPAASPSGTNVAVIEAVASDRGLIAGDVVVINGSGEIERPALNGIAVTALAWRNERTLAFAGLRDFDMIVGELNLDEGICSESWSSPDLTSGDPYPDFCLHGDSGFVLLVDGYHTPSTVLVVNNGETREIAKFAPPAVASLLEHSGQIERLSWRAPDGLDIQGLVVTPEGAGPFPLVTMIHGGPVFCHRGRWLANPYYGDIQFLVRKGYALFLPNPRGSGGRGNAFADRIRGDMGGAECSDLFSGIDLLVSRGIADPKRLGAIGASHGGFMTAWLVTQDHRFAAAVSVAPVSNWQSQHWTSNIPDAEDTSQGAPNLPLLEVRNLCIDFPLSGGGSNRVVDGVDIAVGGGEVLGIIGESGSGKSLSMLAVMGLLPGLARVRADRMHFDGRSLLGLTPRQRARLVGKDIAMIFQEPNTSLNPCFSIGHQIGESIRIHEGGSRASRRMRVLELLAKVGIPDPETRFDAFPHQLSGGMNQRAMIAMAISCNPKLLIADEPTTALDVTIQAQILSLLTELQRERQMAMVLVTHDMAVVADTAQRVSVMYSGQLVEDRPATDLFASPAHPYTAALLNSLPENADGDGPLPTVPGTVPGWNERPNGCLFQPRCRHAFSRCRSDVPPPLAIDGDGMQRGTVRCHVPLASYAQEFPQAEASARIAEPSPPEADDDVLMEAIDLKRHYVLKTGPWKPPVTLKAVDGVSFRLSKGKTLAVVGESGCGKSTLARMASLLEQPSEGELLVDRKQTGHAAEQRGLRSHVQMVFQNPYGSLNPRKTIGATLEEPLAINTRLSRTERVESVRTMMTKVGLRQEHFDRYPHMFSGGQRQRIAIARALMLRPRVVIADEPVSALDISIQAQILNLLQSLQDDFGLAYLFISHDLSVVRHLADDLMVMYLGRPVEYGSRDRIFGAPVHPYSRLLLASRPGLGGGRARILARGELPSPLRPPSGCAFHTRCPAATHRCSGERPEARPIAGRLVACHHAETLASE